MSLINEALKKAQGDRPVGPPGQASGGQPPPPAQPPPKKNRGFFWGFLLAVLIVGTVSSLLAAWLVLQLIEPSAPEPKPVAEVIEAPTLPVREPEPLEPIALTEPEAVAGSPSSVVSEPVPMAEPVEEPEIPLAVPKEQAVKSTPEEPPVEIADTAPPEPRIPAPDPVPAPNPPARPNPEVVTRLLELEIRGIMSGGTKVLIQDTVTGRTRAYQEGDSLEGLYGLVVENIDPSSIQFRDYAGFLHTKSF